MNRFGESTLSGLPESIRFSRKFITLCQSPGHDISGVDLFGRGEWPSSWIHPQEKPSRPSIIYFRLRLFLDERISFRAHITADERYRLYANGIEIAEGTERGDLRHWYFDTFDFEIEPGPLNLLVKVSALGLAAMRSQISLLPGLLFSPEGEKEKRLFGTGEGLGNWEYYLDDRHEFEKPFDHDAFSIGWNCIHLGPGLETEQGQEIVEWRDVVAGLKGANPSYINRSPLRHLLYPSTLPHPVKAIVENLRVVAVENLDDESVLQPLPYLKANSDFKGQQSWSALLNLQESLDVDTLSGRQRILVDLQDYVCADVEMRLSGGRDFSISVRFSESLFDDPYSETKGQRDKTEGKYFRGIGDTFMPDGTDAQFFSNVNRCAGRFVEITLQGGDGNLKIEFLRIIKREYPLKRKADYKTNLSGFSELFCLAERTLTVSSQDCLIDGPYYEQMCWAGDSLQVSLTHYVLFSDDRLIKKTLKLFDGSRPDTGLIRARWPARDWMVIVPYAVYWINAVYEYARWRCDSGFVQSLLLGIRSTVEAILKMRNQDGLIEVHEGWSFVDWVPGWPMGVQNGADGGVNSCVNWSFVNAMNQLSRLEAHFGEIEHSKRCKRVAVEMAETLCATLWRPNKRRFADCLENDTFSEHGQVFAVVSELLPESIQSVINFDSGSELTSATISFSHFVLEAYFRLGRADLLLERLCGWDSFAKNGFLTLPEQPEPSRSDCHAWSAHPVFHYFASILGIRPADFGFRKVSVRPLIDCPFNCEGSIFHPKGRISVRMQSVGNGKELRISIPRGVPAVVEIAGEQISMEDGGLFTETFAIGNDRSDKQ